MFRIKASGDEGHFGRSLAWVKKGIYDPFRTFPLSTAIDKSDLVVNLADRLGEKGSKCVHALSDLEKESCACESKV